MFVELNDETIRVIIKRKSIKNMYFKWSGDDLIVTCNSFLTKREIEKLIKKNAKSLLNLKKRTPVSDLKAN